MYFSRTLLQTLPPLLMSLIISASPVYAQQLSPAEAAEAASELTGGTVLKVNTVNTHGGETDYRIKLLLPQGKVRNIIIDGDNGQAKE